MFYFGFEVLPYGSKHREAVAIVFDESNREVIMKVMMMEIFRDYKAFCRIQSTPAGTFAEGYFEDQTKKSIQEKAWQICNFFKQNSCD